MPAAAALVALVGLPELRCACGSLSAPENRDRDVAAGLLCRHAAPSTGLVSPAPAATEQFSIRPAAPRATRVRRALPRTMTRPRSIVSSRLRQREIYDEIRMRGRTRWPGPTSPGMARGALHAGNGVSASGRRSARGTVTSANRERDRDGGCAGAGRGGSAGSFAGQEDGSGFGPE